MHPSNHDQYMRYIAEFAELSTNIALAYDAAREAVGDSRELHYVMFQLALDSYHAGFEAARDTVVEADRP